MIPRCEICSAFLNCDTDWLGRMVYSHSGPCVPKKHVVLPYDAPESPNERECEECGARFVAGKNTRGKKLCSGKCSRAKQARRKAERDAARGKHWKFETFEGLGIPANECVECGRPFVATGFNGFKTEFCSAICKGVRDARRQAEKRAAKRAA